MAALNEPTAARDRIVRAVLWMTAPANFLVAGLILQPTSVLGQLAGLPQDTPALVYRSLLALFLALFGGVYAWLALQPRIDRPMLALGAIGKGLAFVLTVALWTIGEASTPWLGLLCGDLLCVVVFVWWLAG